jgi:membrane associated rhomboid family serine protease
MAGAIDRVAISKHQCLYETVVGASGAIYVIVAFAFMFPNAELALMFIPVIKAKYFVPVLVLVDLYLGPQDNLFWWRRYRTFCSRWGCFIWLSNYVVLEEESV